jgi:TRAP-type C4-dicarboxylate transport system permease small subunit
MQRWLSRCEMASTYGAVFSVLIMMCLTTVDALGRYFFNSPLGGAYELIEDYLMLVATFLGATICYRRGGFIRVTLLMERMTRKVSIPINYLAQITTILYVVILTFASILNLFRTIVQGTLLGTLPLPKWPGMAFIVLGLLLLSLLLLFDLRRIQKGQSSLFRETSPTAQ